MSTKSYSKAAYHLSQTKSISSPSLEKNVTKIYKSKENPTARFTATHTSNYNRTIKELQNAIDKVEAKKFSSSTFQYTPEKEEFYEEIVCEPETKDIVVHVPKTVGIS